MLRQLEAPGPASARHNNRRSYYLHYSQFQLWSQQKPRIAWITVGPSWLRIILPVHQSTIFRPSGHSKLVWDDTSDMKSGEDESILPWLGL